MARTHAETAFRLAPESTAFNFRVHSARTSLAYALLQDGEDRAARELLAESEEQLQGLLEQGSSGGGIRWEMACIKALQGDVGEALEWTKRAYDQGFRYVREVDLDPMVDPLRDHPEFQALMGRMRADIDEMRRQVLQQEAEVDAAREASTR